MFWWHFLWVWGQNTHVESRGTQTDPIATAEVGIDCNIWKTPSAACSCTLPPEEIDHDVFDTESESDLADDCSEFDPMNDARSDSEDSECSDMETPPVKQNVPLRLYVDEKHTEKHFLVSESRLADLCSQCPEC